MAAIAVRGEPEPVMVSFSQARRAEDATLVRLDVFDGPLALLLTLIEQRQLDVLTVRLGDLAPAFLDALAGLETGRLPLLSTFVSVSAQLILIKSRAVLPRPPVDDRPVAGEDGIDPEEELRQRLIVYRRFRDAGARLGFMATAGTRLFHREADIALASGRLGAVPPRVDPLDPMLLIAALRVSSRLAPPAEPRPQMIARVVTLEARAALIRRALSAARTPIVLQELLRDVRDRVVVAVTFMALLEMVKGREIEIEQTEPWGPISVSALANG
jgi:segregation and condensation protein A